MHIEIGKDYFGFEVLDTAVDPKDQVQISSFRHIKSGAHLVYAKRRTKDTYKSFSIAFRTFAEDDSGIPHILEHCIYAGSKKYPQRYPIAEYEKSSIRQSGNGVTYKDMTSYYFGTENDKDFFNLLDLHLDCIFFPEFYHNELVFQQEGWRYELDEKGNLGFNGIVYNEMQDVIAARKTNQAFFKNSYPDSFLCHITGGDPLHIPEATNEKIIAFHKKYYIPQNAYISLSGDMDLDKVLEYLDKEYLSKFNYNKAKEIEYLEPKLAPIQKDLTLYIFDPYASSLDEKTLFFSWPCGSFRETQHYRDIYILSELFFRNMDAPVWKAIREAGYGNISVEAFEEQNSFVNIEFALTVKDLSIKANVLDIVNNTILDILEHDKLPALLEEYLKEKIAESKSSCNDSLGFSAFLAKAEVERWLRGREDILLIYHNPFLAYLEQAVHKPMYFAELTRRYILENVQRLVYAIISTNDNTEREQQEEQLIAEHTVALQAEDYDKIVTMNNKLAAWQASKQDYSGVPRLKIADLDWEIPKVEKSLIQTAQGRLLYIPRPMPKGLVNLDVYIEPEKMSHEQLYMLRIFNQIFWELRTDKYSSEELRSIGYKLDMGKSYAFFREKEQQLYFPHLLFTATCLEEDSSSFVDFVENVLQGMQVEDLTSIKNKLERLLESDKQGDVSLMHTELYNYDYCLELDAYLNDMSILQNTLENWEEQGEEFLLKLLTYVKEAFACNRRTIVYSCSEQTRTKLEPSLKQFCEQSCEAKPLGMEPQYPYIPPRLGIVYNNDVQQLTLGEMIQASHPSGGSLAVLSMIIEGEYLYKRVREDGGAYDASFYVDVDEMSMLFSVSRDSNVAKTLKLIYELPDWLESLDISQELLEHYIISTYGDWYLKDTSRETLDIMRRAAKELYGEASYEQHQKVWYEIKNTTLEQVRAWAEPMREVLENARLMLCADRTTLEDNKAYLDEIITYEEFYKRYAGI